MENRILFVDHAAVLGGAELSLLDLAKANRHRSSVLLFESGPFLEKLSLAGVNVETITVDRSILSIKSSNSLKNLRAIFKLWKVVSYVREEGKKYDLIYANSQKSFIIAALARWLGGTPVVWHLRDIITSKHFSLTNRWIAVQLANSQACRVIVNSKATGAAFVAAGGHSSLVRLMYNGLSSEPFENLDKETVASIRAELNISSEAILIGSFSRLSYWKGQHILLDAIRFLPDVHVLIVGEALFGEDDYANRLKDLAKIPSLANRVHWLGFRSDIPELMVACNIIVHTSTEPEPFGRVIVEGQLSRRPVIATRAGGAEELIEDGKTGLLVSPGNSEALMSAIQYLLDNPFKMQEISRNAYDHARKNFSLERLLKEFEDLF